MSCRSLSRLVALLWTHERRRVFRVVLRQCFFCIFFLYRPALRLGCYRLRRTHRTRPGPVRNGRRWPASFAGRTLRFCSGVGRKRPTEATGPISFTLLRSYQRLHVSPLQSRNGAFFLFVSISRFKHCPNIVFLCRGSFAARHSFIQG